MATQTSSTVSEIPAADASGGRTLDGMTALVTGSSRGLGRGMAVRLAGQGALVAVHGRDRQAAQETVNAVEAAGGRAFPVLADLGERHGVQQLVSGLQTGLLSEHGEIALDILVNCAGFSNPRPFDTITHDSFDELIATNARAALFIIQQTLPFMRDNGRIINISSALTRFAWIDEVAFAMSKAALEQLALHLARTLGARGITINTVAPGPTDNGHLPIAEDADLAAEGDLSAFGRFGTIADIADIVAFLTSHDGRWVTGAWIDATGGVLS